MKTIARKLAETAAEVGFAEFDSKNTMQKYQYASAASVIRMVNKALSSRGISVSSTPQLLNYESIGEDKKGAKAVVSIRLTFTDGETGEQLHSGGLGEGKDYGDKAIYKANTGAYKYALAHAFVMAWGAEDPEADTSVDGPEPKDSPRPKVKQVKKPSARKGKTAAKDTTADDLMASIVAAEQGALLELKPQVIALRDTEQYDALVAAYKAREAALAARVE